MPRRRIQPKVLLTILAVGVTVWALVPVIGADSRPLSKQVYPDSAEYADAAWELAQGHGYVTFFDEPHPGQVYGHIAEPPRYPFGTSAALAPFAAVIPGWPHSVLVGAKVISVVYVLIVVVAAWYLGGPLAAAIAALLVGLSPFAHVSATLILSDPLAAILAVVVMLGVMRGSRLGLVVAGAAAGAAIDVRLLGVVLIPAALVAAGRKRWIPVALAAVPFIAALALYQWKTFGSPFTTGYDHWLPRAREFDLSFVSSKGVFGQPIRDKLNGALLNWLVCPCDRSPGIPGGSSVSALPNYAFYPAALAGIFWVYAPPFTALIGAVQLWRERMTPAARYSIVTIVLSVVLLLFYFYQAERFLAPTASLLLIYTAAGASSLLSAAWRWLHRRRPATSTPTPITQPT